MPLEEIVAWGGLGTMIIALLGGALLRYDFQLRRRQLRETLSRSYSTLNIDFQVSVHPKSVAFSEIPEWVLETRVTIENAGSEIRAIPAAYVHARALPDLSNEDCRTFLEREFCALKPIGQLSEPTNIAWFDSAIWHVGPDEKDSTVRWDVLSSEFIRQYPIIIMRLEVYSVPNEFIGAAYSAESAAGVDRRQWLEFMGGDDGARHKKVIFSHAAQDTEDFKKGDWVFLNPKNDGVDTVKSKDFRKVLANCCQTGRQILVVLDTPESRAVIGHYPNSPPGSVAAEQPENERPTPSLNRTAPLRGTAG